MTQTVLDGWSRVAMAIEKVAERLRRSTEALETAGVPYAVIGGNAVAEWVGRVDEGAVRFTRDVDILLRRDDLPAAIAAMEAAGFEHHQTFGVDMFVEPGGKPSEGVHVIFAGERVKADDPAAAPNVDDSVEAAFRVIDLESIVRMKLTSFRDKDRTHLRDMIGVGLIDEGWVGRYPTVLAGRLQELFDNPEG